MSKILLAIGVIAVVLGVKMIYDARPMIKMYFSFGDENDAALGLKILGFLFAVIGGILVYFNF